MAGTRRSLAQIFLFPALVAVVVLVGLVSALLGDGIWDAVSWIALAFPLAIFALFHWKRTSRQEQT
jgi:hypothetical protein